MGDPKTISVEVSEAVKLLEQVKIRKMQDGFMIGETVSREKISGKSKRLTHEILSIDRSNPSQTVKHHRVQELDEKGDPIGDLHEHTNSSPAKRRPPSKT